MTHYMFFVKDTLDNTRMSDITANLHKITCLKNTFKFSFTRKKYCNRASNLIKLQMSTKCQNKSKDLAFSTNI